MSISFELTHPTSNEYALEGYYYTSESFDRRILVRKVDQWAIPGLAGLKKCGDTIGIDRDDSPSPDVELADRYIPLIYAALLLVDWMAADSTWFGGKQAGVYLMNFGVEAIPIGTLKDGRFLRAPKFL